jgi:hypothetical protein
MKFTSRAGIKAVRFPCCEILEHRRLLHAGHVHQEGLGQPGYKLTDHVLAADFRKMHPELAGKDLFDPKTFDPRNTGDPHKFLYDPHMIVDDRPVTIKTMKSRPGGAGGSLNGGPEAPVTLLPDIVPLTYNPYLQPYIDTTEIPGHNLMRFSTAVANMGGPVALTSSNTAVDGQGRQIVTQTVYKYDSVTNAFSQDYQREAGRFVWHSGHGHFHLEGYANYRLRHNTGGQPGAIVLRNDGTEAVGDKIGFCLIDILQTFTRPDNGQSSNTVTGYSGTGQPSNGCGFQQGLRVGRADVYDSIYDGQWIDVTGVANGSYFLEVTIDAMNAIQESNENNNTVFVAYTLNANPPSGGVQADRFEPNNTFATATDLGESGVQTQAGLTIHITDEPDYFKFVAASTGSSSVQLTIADRDVNLFLYDANQTLLGSSTSPTSGTPQNPHTETVNWNFVKGQTYYVLAKGFGTAQGTGGISSSYAVKINVKPTVDASAPTPTASAAAGPGVIRVTRNGPVNAPLTVNLTYSGTAVSNVDYVPLPSSVIIGNEASFIDIPVTIKPGATISNSKTVIANVSTNASYVVGTSSATVTLLENIKPQLVDQHFGFQQSPHTLVFRFNEDLGASVQTSDVLVMNSQNQPVPVAGVTWDWNAGSGIGTATFSFNGVLPNNGYTATIAAANMTDAAGNPLSANANLAFSFLMGDLDNNGAIDGDDYALIDMGFNLGLTGYVNGDVNYDGVIDGDDYAIIDLAFNTQ